MGGVLITGGTSGLGLALARELRSRGGDDVVITGRDGVAAAQVAGANGVRSTSLDLGSLADVAAAVDRLAAMDALPLGGVVANAGVQFTRPASTADGFEATFGVNHLGHVALIARLLAAEAIAIGGRIAIVSSGTHDADLRTGMPKPWPIDAAQLSRPAPPDEGATESRRRYTTSKLANVMTAYALARRLEGVPIAVNAFDPGLMPGTGLVRDASAVTRLLWSTVAHALVATGRASSPRRSARTLAGLALGELPVSGTYWSVDHERRSSTASYDEPAQERLWQDSLQLIELPDPTISASADGAAAADG